MQISISQLDEYLSPTEKDWLIESGSLTRRLRALTNHCIEFRVLQDQWGVADEISRLLVNRNNQDKTWIRHIEWRHHDVLWVEAIVIIPEKSIKYAPELQYVGQGSIGDLLFQDPTLKRSDFIFEKQEDDFLRRSIFYYKKQPLLISERFLSAFLHQFSGRTP